VSAARITARAADELVVHKGEQPVARLVRTRTGARLDYDEAYADRHTGDPARALATTLPVRRDGQLVEGVNLHPFFAGLLPEGLRFRALVRAVKTSEDDLFSLLAASGPDMVGDVWCAAAGIEPAPMIEVRTIDEASFAELAERSLAGEDSSTFAGVQPKVSAGRIALGVRLANARRLHILKLAAPEFPGIVENEAFCMDLARAVGLTSARCSVVRDRGGVAGLLVERFDRVPRSLPPEARPRGLEAFERLHVEDLCQVLGRYPADKYRITLAEVARALELATSPVVELQRLLEMQAFSYVIANGDLHAKNLSLLWRDGRIRLAPAYDLVSTLVYGDTHMALKLDGRDQDLKRSNFVAFGTRFGLRAVATERMLTRLITRLRRRLTTQGGIAAMGLAARRRRQLERTLAERLDQLAS
jgi:serine/threonine-protein kinase HipA